MKPELEMRSDAVYTRGTGVSCLQLHKHLESWNAI